MGENLVVVRTEGSTALVLILTFGVGVVVGVLSSLPGRTGARHKLREVQKKENEPRKRTSPKPASVNKFIGEPTGTTNDS